MSDAVTAIVVVVNA